MRGVTPPAPAPRLLAQAERLLSSRWAPSRFLQHPRCSLLHSNRRRHMRLHRWAQQQHPPVPTLPAPQRRSLTAIWKTCSTMSACSCSHAYAWEGIRLHRRPPLPRRQLACRSRRTRQQAPACLQPRGGCCTRQLRSLRCRCCGEAPPPSHRRQSGLMQRQRSLTTHMPCCRGSGSCRAQLPGCHYRHRCLGREAAALAVQHWFHPAVSGGLSWCSPRRPAGRQLSCLLQRRLPCK